jgi:uncharacterized repeat protein (TIGR01451 family)
LFKAASEVLDSERKKPQPADDTFLRLFSTVPAISTESRAPGEAVNYFHKSREKLETDLQIFYSDRKKSLTSITLQDISARHACLSLVYWLYPNYVGYNRARNAVKMFQHASAAQATSVSKCDLSYGVGLLVQLRITPFLVRTKKKTLSDLASARNSATEFLQLAKSHSRADLSAIVGDGLGFSYFLFERDIDKALQYITRATDEIEFSARALDDGVAPSTNKRNLKLLLGSFSAALFWDLGICYEGKAEGTEGEEMLEFLKKSRSAYQKALEYSMASPWHIYRAMSAYNLSGTYFREGMTEFERSKAVPLLKHSVEIGEESLKWFHLWSTLEEDFLGGSWIASFYQNLANYSEDPSKKELMRRSLELAKKADVLINNKKIGLSRYKAANVGDIFFRNSEYCWHLAVELKSEEAVSEEGQIAELLSRSLADCLKSRTFYKDRAFGNRRINSALLAGDIYLDLLTSRGEDDSSRRTYSSKAGRYFHESAKISKKLGLSETLATSSWRLAQLFDVQGQFSKSAEEYSRAHHAFDSAKSSETTQLYEDSSKYMLAWSNIETAKWRHVSSKFEEASKLYGQASGLIASTKRWKSRAHLYSAESLIEQAEKESLSESSAASIDLFSKAKESLSKLESGLTSDSSIEARSFVRFGRRLSSFCDARIILEKSKEDFRMGNIESSLGGLSNAGREFSSLSKDYSPTNPVEANELQSLASLCLALEHFQRAQVSSDPSLFKKASEIFSTASESSKSASLKPLLKGLSSFAAFLYSSKLLEQSLEASVDVERLTECSEEISSAERVLARLGAKSLLAMLRASKLVLDASIKISAAEREVEDQETKAKLYSQAQRSLSLASKYYETLGSSQKLKESLNLLSSVKQNRELIPLANKMFAEVASTQMLYSAVSSSTILGASPEDSARQIESAFLALDVSVSNTLVLGREDLSITLTLTNIGKERAAAVKIEDILPEGMDLAGDYPNIRSKGKSMDLSLKIEPGASEIIKIAACGASPGEFTWHPLLIYQDATGNQKTTSADAVRVVIDDPNLADNVQSLRLKKEKLEGNLLSALNDDEKIAVREDLSKTEEELHRLKNDYENMQCQQEQVRQDLIALNSMRDDALRSEEKKKLESELEILTKRIERRRELFPHQ